MPYSRSREKELEEELLSCPKKTTTKVGKTL
jgi:hypothetical protein